MFDSKSGLRVATLAVGTIVIAACQQQPERSRVDPERTTPAVTEQEIPGDESASDIAATTARARISDLKVGTVLGADGAVAENQDELERGAAVLVSVAVGDVGAGSSVKAVWLAEDDRKLAEQTLDVAAGQAFLVFRGPEPASWAPGDYEVEIYLGDELAASEQFEIVERAG